MNDWDKMNLRFILQSSPEDLLQFCNESDEDDIKYAMELLAVALEEVLEQQITFASEEKPGDLYPEANTVLQKFRLQK